MPSSIHPMIRQIVDRDCHVGMSCRAVMRHVIGRLRHGRVSFLRLPRGLRRLFLAQCRERHRQNQAEYRHVTSGVMPAEPRQRWIMRNLRGEILCVDGLFRPAAASGSVRFYSSLRRLEAAAKKRGIASYHSSRIFPEDALDRLGRIIRADEL